MVIMPRPLNINSNIFKDKEQICILKILPWHIFLLSAAVLRQNMLY